MQAITGCFSVLFVCFCGVTAIGVANSIIGNTDDTDPTSTIVARASTPITTQSPAEATTTSTPVAVTPVPLTNTPSPESTATPEPPPTETPVPPATNIPEPMAGMTLAMVTNVVDGDTIDVRFDGQEHRIRIIGVDTPETKDPNQPVMCFGAEATAFTKDMISRAGNEVYLEKDVSETDRYDRLLRYVWLPHDDGTRMLNQELVAQGYAQSSTYPPDVKYQDLFVEAQQQARDEGRGLWGACGEFGVPLATPTPVAPPPTSTPVPAAPPTSTPVPAAPPPPPVANCDPSYPDPGVCIPPPPPDLDCGDIPYGRFTVLPPDPHGFDGNDNDGLGCESN